MVVDYGAPLVNSLGDVIGVVDYAIASSDFTRIVDTLSVGEAGYGFTYEPGGAILSHPNPDYLLDNVFQLRDGKDETTIAKLRDDREGVVAYNSTYTYKYSWFFFKQLDSTGWKSVLVFAVDDLLGASDEGRRKIIHIAIGISLLVVTIFLFALGINQHNRGKLWRMVAAVSIVIVADIIVIWYLNLHIDFSLFDSEPGKNSQPIDPEKVP